MRDKRAQRLKLSTIRPKMFDRPPDSRDNTVPEPRSLVPADNESPPDRDEWRVDKKRDR